MKRWSKLCEVPEQLMKAIDVKAQIRVLDKRLRDVAVGTSESQQSRHGREIQ